MTPPLARLAARNDNAPREATVGDLMIEWARRTPYRIVIADVAPGAPPRSWTCEALRDDAATLAVALLSRYAPGERIAVWARPCPETVLLQFAAAFAGLVLVSIDPVWRSADMAHILGLSESVGLFVMSQGDERRLTRAAEYARPGIREIVDLADRRVLFAKHRCVDGLPEVGPGDLAQIRYPAGLAIAQMGDILLHRDLADALRAARDVVAPRVGREVAMA